MMSSDKLVVFNYLRYFVVLFLLASFFYTYSLEVKHSTIKKALDKKMPITNFRF